MNRIALYLTCWTALMAFTFCGSDDSSSSDSSSDDVYITENLPSNYTVETPDTLSVSGTLDSKAGLGKLTQEECNVLLGVQDAENGYETLKSKVDEIKDFAKDFELEFLMIDQIIPQLTAAWEASAQDAPLEYGGGELDPVVVSQGMYNRIAQILEPILAEIALINECFPGGGPDLTLDDLLPFRVGDEIPTPPLSYEYDGTGAYNNTIVYSFDQSGAAGGDIPDDISLDASTTIKWTDDKLRLAITRKFADDFGDSTSVSTYDASGDVATSTFTDSSEFSDPFVGSILFEYSINLNECQSDSERCVELFYSNKSEDTFGTFSEVIVGKADNSGGFIQTTYSGSDGFGTFEDIFRELFDAEGNIIATEEAINGVFSGSGDFGDSPFFEELAGSGGGFDGGLQFGVAIEVNFSGLGSEEDFAFVLVPNGITPGNEGTEQRFEFEINILGAGYVFIDNAAGINERFADFWGPDNFNFGSLKVWEESYDGSSISYTLISGATVSAQ